MQNPLHHRYLKPIKFFAAFLLLFVIFDGIAQCNRKNDSLQLVRLYTSTNGVSWKTPWKLQDPMNTWYGVKLNTAGCVTHIDLDGLVDWGIGAVMGGNGIRGTIPNFNLPNLESLSLGGNQLSGVIPNFNLPNLQSLIFFENQLSGAIPNFNLPSLKSLLLFDNQLSGTIPNFNLPNLQSLLLGGNQLSGAIPNFNLPNLQFLLLYENQLSGIIPDFNLPSLKSLLLYDNQLSGTIPNFNNCPNVKSIHLYNNQLSGCYPSVFNKFCSLGFSPDLVFDGYNFTGNNKLPWQGDFQRFCNGENQTGATCDDGNANTTNDKIQADCSCKGALIGSSTCRQTDSLALVAMYNALGGQNWTNKWDLSKPITNKAAWFGVLTNTEGCVTHIDLDGVEDWGYVWNENNIIGNNLRGILPNEITELKSLAFLNLSDNPNLIGNLPLDLGNLSALKQLISSRTNHSGVIPTSIAQLSLLEVLDISFQQDLTGGIPDGLWFLPNLNYVSLTQNPNLNQGNSLSTAIKNAKELQFLNLGNSGLGGNIPKEIGEATKLKQLLLYSNKLKGAIPNELNQLNSLEYLALNDNLLEGTIPNFSMSSLQRLILAYNQLSGSIPSFERLSTANLKYIYLHKNNLSGCFPDALKRFCPLGFSDNHLNQGYNFTQNPKLSWQGDFQRFCNNEAQTGATCDDGDATTSNDVIQTDCTCKGKSTVNPCASFSVSAGADKSICIGESVELKATGNGTTFQWQGGTSTANWTVKPTQTSTYIVSSNGGACAANDTIVVRVNPLPQVSLTKDTAICKGQNLTLTAKTNATGAKYAWSNNENTQSVSFKVEQATTLTVTVTDANNCKNSANSTIKLKNEKDCQNTNIDEIDEACLENAKNTLPNAFSPYNKDAVNDDFDPLRLLQQAGCKGLTSENVEFVIYENGQIVFNPQPYEAWKGFYKNIPSAQSLTNRVFDYVIRFSKNNKYKIIGKIAVLDAE